MLAAERWPWIIFSVTACVIACVIAMRILNREADRGYLMAIDHALEELARMRIAHAKLGVVDPLVLDGLDLALARIRKLRLEAKRGAL